MNVYCAIIKKTTVFRKNQAQTLCGQSLLLHFVEFIDKNKCVKFIKTENWRKPENYGFKGTIKMHLLSIVASLSMLKFWNKIFVICFDSKLCWNAKIQLNHKQLNLIENFTALLYFWIFFHIFLYECTFQGFQPKKNKESLDFSSGVYIFKWVNTICWVFPW